MFSIFHFFVDLVGKRKKLVEQNQLDKFPFAKKMLSCYQDWTFPDAAIRVNPKSHKNPFLSGGELLEFKDGKTYSIPSFNSTIPTGKKCLTDLGTLAEKMANNGDTPDALPVRQVYYLLRGRQNKENVTKVCLVHGSFFETINVNQLIKSSFSQVIGDASSNNNSQLTEKEREKFIEIFSQQDIFATTRKVDRASVSMRFRIMTEVRKEANIFNKTYYPEIADNTLNLIVPVHGETVAKRHSQEKLINDAIKTVGIPKKAKETFLIKHPFNGYFWVLQVPLS